MSVHAAPGRDPGLRPQHATEQGPEPESDRAGQGPEPVGASDLGQLSHDLRFLLGRLVRRVRSEHRFGITHTAVLGRLYREGPHCIGELASLERVRPQSMSQTLAELETEGLIQRAADADDGRRTRIALTALGRSVVESDRASSEGWLAAQMAGFTPAEQEILRAALPLLDRLTHSA